MTGAGKSVNYPIFKGIRISKEQAENWDPDKIRQFLDNDNSAALDIIREMFEKGVIKVYAEKLTEKYRRALEEL